MDELKLHGHYSLFQKHLHSFLKESYIFYHRLFLKSDFALLQSSLVFLGFEELFFHKYQAHNSLTPHSPKQNRWSTSNSVETQHRLTLYFLQPTLKQFIYKIFFSSLGSAVHIYYHRTQTV